MRLYALLCRATGLGATLENNAAVLARYHIKLSWVSLSSQVEVHVCDFLNIIHSSSPLLLEGLQVVLAALSSDPLVHVIDSII